MKFYDKVLSAMTAKYEELAGFIPDDASDIGVRLKVLAGQLDQLNNHIDQISAQLFPQSSTGEYLERHGQLRGLVRKKESCSTGKLLFSRTSPAPVDIPIPNGTLVSTSTEPSLFFTTKESCVLKAGNVSISAPATAQNEGSESNVAAKRINLLVSSVPGITTVSNQAAFSGAFDMESDLSFRSRLLYSYQNMTTGSNIGYYYNYAIAHPNVRFANVIPKISGLGTVGVVVALKDKNVSPSTLNVLNNYFVTNREICSVVLVSAAKEKPVDISIGLEVKEGYLFETVSKACEEALRQYVNNLGIGVAVSRNLLGKVVLDVEGAQNYTILAPAADISVSAYDFSVINTVTISRKEG